MKQSQFLFILLALFVGTAVVNAQDGGPEAAPAAPSGKQKAVKNKVRKGELPPPPPPASGNSTNKIDDLDLVNYLYEERAASTALRAPKTVVKGKQTWMAENLDVTTFRNGDPIPEVKTEKDWVYACLTGKPAWCYYNNDPANGKKYGKLYNQNAVNDPRGLAPAGWHIPSRDEWKTDISSSFVGSSSKPLSPSGLECFPGGCRKNENNAAPFQDLDKKGYWWSTSPIAAGMSVLWCFYLEVGSQAFGETVFGKEGLSVRCVKD